MSNYVSIKDADKRNMIEIDVHWIGIEACFDYIVETRYDETNGMKKNRTYLLEKDEIDYAISILKRMNDDFPAHRWTTEKVIKVLEGIGDECYVRWTFNNN